MWRQQIGERKSVAGSAGNRLEEAIEYIAR